MEEQRFYNYIYLDPTKPKTTIIKGLNIILKHEPFYIGKGTGDRYKQHKYKQSGKSMKCKMKSLRNKNIEPIICLLIKNLTNEESCKNEEYLIKTIGRKDLNKGPLCNLTDGGEKGCGQIVSKETKNKMRNNNLGKKLSEEHKQKIGLANKGKISKKTLDAQKEYWKHNKRISKNNKKVKMLDLQDNIIKIFNSCREADLYMNYHYGVVNKMCINLGKCRYKPFKFRYND
jgi:hypothetical protein